MTLVFPHPTSEEGPRDTTEIVGGLAGRAVKREVVSRHCIIVKVKVLATHVSPPDYKLRCHYFQE